MPFKLDPTIENYLQSLQSALFICEEHEIVWVNESALNLLGASGPDAVLGTPFEMFAGDDYAELFADGLKLIAGEDEPLPLELKSVDGAKIDVRLSINETLFDDGQVRFLVDFQNITELIKASEINRHRENRIHAILEAVDQAIISIDHVGRIQIVNEVACKMFGYAKTDLVGENVSILLPSPHREQHDSYLRRYRATGYSNMVGATHEMEAIRADGTLFPIELTVAVVRGAGDEDTYTGSIRDITDRKEKEDRIRYLALYDQLTGLANRASFNESVSEALSRARRIKSGIALMFIDLDKFKPINDTYGHEAGDIVLTTVAQRLEEAIRNTDTAARLGGDEFVVILENISERENIEVVARKVLESMARPIDIGEETCSVSASIGISHYPENGETLSDLLNAADQAMYKVKATGRNNFAFS